MQVYRSLNEYPPQQKPVATIGTFDGVHRGHQVILGSLVEEARSRRRPSLVITFHPHPRKVLGKDENLQLLNTLEERLDRLRASYIDQVLVIPFTPQFASLTSQDFIQQVLVAGVGVHHLAIGYDHRFGRNRGGGLEELRQAGAQHGFSVREIPAQQIDAATVSSTKIRRALEAGEVAQANRMLGYRYPLRGQVVEGDRLGRSLGYPTANLAHLAEEKLTPAPGVYAVQVELQQGRLEAGMLNWGTRPTVAGKARRLEVNILDFAGDLYGQELRVHYLQRLRNEMSFQGLDALKAQLAQDEADTRRVYAQPPPLLASEDSDQDSEQELGRDSEQDSEQDSNRDSN